MLFDVRGKGHHEFVYNVKSKFLITDVKFNVFCPLYIFI